MRPMLTTHPEDIYEVLLGVHIEHSVSEQNPVVDDDMSDLFLDMHQEVRITGTGTDPFFDRFIWRILLVHLKDGADFPDIYWEEPYYLIPVPCDSTFHSITFGREEEETEDVPERYAEIILTNRDNDFINIRVPLEEHSITLEEEQQTIH
jgi:hypothetical protein